MSPEPSNPKPQPAPPRASPAPMPQRSATPGAVPGPARSRTMTLVYGAVVVAALAVGAVATGVVHLPGFGSGEGAPAATATQQSDVQQVDQGDNFLGIMYRTLTPELAKSRQLGRDAGVVITGVVSNSPIDKAGVRVNDVVVAVDGVPIRVQGDLAAKLRLTPIGQQLSFTLERGGVVQDHTATMGRCLVRDANEKNLAQACKSWTN